ncbi:hypothetical protein [uncultured Fibrobacter sp.]|uniref:hypothetical protein n=1 Tax=uncultured Fibrobacter sp. TaxID=261512 RepID=UPI0025D937F4|nr:hypothetical protein [uncultured Fibrobacter sp.]
MSINFQDVDVMKALIAPESYFQNFVIAIYQRIELTTDESWVSPNEMLQQIKGKDKTLYDLIEDYFILHKAWYADFNNDQKQSQATSKLKEIKEYMKTYY